VTYLGLDVLLLSPNAPEGLEEPIDPRVVRLDPRTGPPSTREASPAPAISRELSSRLRTPAAIAAMLTFLDAREGRTVPFWIPSWHLDLRMAQDLANGAASLVIQYSGYTAGLFPATGARRHLALLTEGDLHIHKVGGAADPGTFTTETLTLATPAARDFAAGNTLVMFLLLCRLAEDFVPFSFLRPGLADVTLPMIELPLEAPA
jgi:hypothetical protein